MSDRKRGPEVPRLMECFDLAAGNHVEIGDALCMWRDSYYPCAGTDDE
jgi:hypothetical protein